MPSSTSPIANSHSTTPHATSHLPLSIPLTPAGILPYWAMAPQLSHDNISSSTLESSSQKHNPTSHITPAEIRKTPQLDTASLQSSQSSHAHHQVTISQSHTDN